MLAHTTEWGDPEAPTIVLLAGGGGTRWLWTPHADRLREDYHAVALDLPAHGTHPEASFSVERAIRDVGDILDDCGSAVLVGHSIGGQVAMEAAAAHEDRVEGLVVAGVSGETSRLKAAVFFPLSYLLEAAAHVPPIRAWIDDQWGLDDERQLPPASVDAHDAAIAMARSGRGTLFSDPMSAAAAYDGPTLLTYGTEEMGEDAAEAVADRVDARLRWFDGGHGYPSRQPEGFVALVSQFLGDVCAPQDVSGA